MHFMIRSLMSYIFYSYFVFMADDIVEQVFQLIHSPIYFDKTQVNHQGELSQGSIRQGTVGCLITL